MVSALHGSFLSDPGNQSRKESMALAAPVVRLISREIPLPRQKARPICTARTIVIPVGRENPRLSPVDFEVPRISRNEQRLRELKILTQAAVDLVDSSIFSEFSEADNPLSEQPVKKPRKPRSPAQHIEPLPITEREVITFKEAAAIGPKTENALRHLAFMVSAYAKLGFEGKPHLAKFAGCICRQPGQRRIYLNRQRLLAYFAWERDENV